MSSTLTIPFLVKMYSNPPKKSTKKMYKKSELHSFYVEVLSFIPPVKFMYQDFLPLWIDTILDVTVLKLCHFFHYYFIDQVQL